MDDVILGCPEKSAFNSDDCTNQVVMKAIKTK